MGETWDKQSKYRDMLAEFKGSRCETTPGEAKKRHRVGRNVAVGSVVAECEMRSVVGRKAKAARIRLIVGGLQ